MKVTIDIPDADRPQVEQWVAEHGYTWIEDTTQLADFHIPEWQKELTRQRRAAAKPEDYTPWDEVKKRWGL
jgi:hypothetical protein